MYKLRGNSRREVLLKFENVEEDEWYIDNDNNIQKLLRIKLIDCLLLLIKVDSMQVSQNLWEILLKELFLIKFKAYYLQMQ